MRYKPSEEICKALLPFGSDVGLLMKYSLIRYFQTGKNPGFDTIDLRELWFYCKMHELADQIQRKGYSWVGTFEHLELQSYLTKNASKLANWHFHLEKEYE